MRNKFAASGFFTLLILAGLGFVFKGVIESGSNSEQSSTSTVRVESPVDDQMKARRLLFQPIAPSASRANTIPIPVFAPEKPPDTAVAPRSDSPAPLAKTASSTNLLQGNQSKQRATRFTKIDFSGQALPDLARRWSCAQDINTGLLWETKLFDAGISDVEHRYSWYNPARSTPGFANRGSCFAIHCDTYTYTREINRLGLCGSRHWRLPSFAELETLLDRGYFNPVINQEIFFNTRGASYWTQSQLENNPEMVMQIDFFNGTSSPAPIHFKLAVRLVSDE